MNAAWERYLDELEVAVCELEHTLAEHGTPQWEVPEPPDGNPPDGTLARRDGLLARMMVAAHAIEGLREGIRAEIESLPMPRRRTVTAYAGTIGTNFDFSG